MTLSLSTSSPQASVALLDSGASVVWQGSELAPNAASGAIVRLLTRALAETGVALESIDLFAADLGPGSFTGVRVGIVFAKLLAHAQGAMTCGATAFDLIGVDKIAFVPSRRNEVYVRRPGMEPIRQPEPPADGCGYQFGTSGEYPKAAGFASLLTDLARVEPELLLPKYLAEPSISLPKRPFTEAHG